MQSSRVLILLLLCVLAPLAAVADEVRFANGDRITGRILKLDGGKLVIESAVAGPVFASWDQVTAIRSSTPLHVSLKDGQLNVGEIEFEGEEFVVRTRDAGPVRTTKAAIASIRSTAEQVAWDQRIERYRNPRLLDLWTGFFDLGYSQASGNADTRNLAVNASASRSTSRDKISVNFTTLYASTSTEGIEAVTANAIRGGLSYSLNVTPKLFAFGSVDLEYDEFQSLDLRFAPAAGMGYKVVDNSRTTFSLLAGGSLNREFFSDGLRRTSGELLVGNELSHRMNDRVLLRQKLTFYPNISDLNSYRLNFDFSAETKVWRWMGWTVSVSDRFLSNPAPGRQKNDLLLSTGLRITFAEQPTATLVMPSTAGMFGTLVTVAAGPADLYINNSYVGRTGQYGTPDSGLRLRPGFYQVKIAPREGAPIERRVEVLADKATTVQ